MPHPWLLFQEKSPPTLSPTKDEIGCTACGRTSHLSQQEIKDVSAGKIITCPKSRYSLRPHQLKPFSLSRG